MIKVGYRAHDFGSFETATELGKRVAQVDPEGIIQLALKKVIPSSRPWKDWDEEYISGIRDELKAQGVRVAIVGCYINCIAQDEEVRKKEIARFKKSLSLTKAFGCPYVGTETGTASPSGGGYSIETSSPKNLDLFKDTLSQLLDAAEKYDAYVAVECVARTHTISSRERMARIIESMGTDRLKTIFDPVNLIPYTGIPESDGVALEIPSEEAEAKFVSDVLDLYKGRLVAIHCKDYVLDKATGFKHGDLPALTGVFRWDSFAREMKKRGLEDIPWLLENMNPLTALETTRRIQSF